MVSGFGFESQFVHAKRVNEVPGHNLRELGLVSDACSKIFRLILICMADRPRPIEMERRVLPHAFEEVCQSGLSWLPRIDPMNPLSLALQSCN